ncbi:MAG: 3-phosphoshikimate 1-carboxyvinyltransferase [Acutalibacteraceae bacterium]
MDIRIKGSAVSGAFDAVASKSDVHRALICAALSDKPSKIKFESSSEDIEATVRCLNALGAEITIDKNGAEVKPIKKVNHGALLDCGESGSTVRFMIPVSAALGAQSRFTGRGRLAERPLEPLATVMKSNGCSFSQLGVFPLEVGGALRPGDYEIPGNVSSQFITGLLLALPVAGGGSVKVIPPVESQKYIDMTVKTMIKYGARIKRDGFDFYVEKSGYSPKQDEYISDGDWSNSAFFLCAAAVSGSVR